MGGRSFFYPDANGIKKKLLPSKYYLLNYLSIFSTQSFTILSKTKSGTAPLDNTRS